MSVLSPEQQQHWAEHIQAWRDSGLTQQAYCREHALAPHRFWYWKRKLGEASDAAPAKTVPARESGFVPVTLRPSSSPAEGLMLQLPNGIQLCGITSDNVALARHLAEALR